MITITSNIPLPLACHAKQLLLFTVVLAAVMSFQLAAQLFYLLWRPIYRYDVIVYEGGAACRAG